MGVALEQDYMDDFAQNGKDQEDPSADPIDVIELGETPRNVDNASE